VASIVRSFFCRGQCFIVFSRVTSIGEDIYVMRKDGTNLHQITDTPGQDEEFGEWSVRAPAP